MRERIEGRRTNERFLSKEDGGKQMYVVLHEKGGGKGAPTLACVGGEQVSRFGSEELREGWDAAAVLHKQFSI